MASLLSLLCFFFLLSLASTELLLEEGYAVTTVIDGHKLHINPHEVLARPGSSDLIVLDSSSSTFYSLSFPLSQGSEVKQLSGDGIVGYSDGELGHARFNKPRSFAVDAKGNIYVADKHNHAIRKISNSGTVTTIAGGLSNKTGRQDGPAQNASFSDDFELAFIPERCVLLISDHGNQLVRQINLKVEDCARSSHSALGAASIWALGLGLSCLLGLAIGIAVRPYIIPPVSFPSYIVVFYVSNGLLMHFLTKLCRQEGSSFLQLSRTWKHCLINLGKHILMPFFGIRSAVAKSVVFLLLRKLFWLTLSHLSLMFGLNIVNSGISPTQQFVPSLLDSDDLNSGEVKSSEIISDELKDLLSFDGTLELPNMSKQGDGEQEESDVLPHCHGRLDCLIQAHVDGIVKAAQETTTTTGSLLGSSALVKRI